MAARPDQQYYPAAGGAQIPGSRTGKIRANQVIITGNGPNAGLFVYAVPPALGLGNPPVFSVVAPGVTHDPFGNAVAAVLEAGTIGTNFLQVDASGDLILYNAGNQVMIFNPAKQAIFVYSPAAGAGNLVLSYSPVSGTDAFGNAYLSGFVSYFKQPPLFTQFFAAQLDVGGLLFWTATAAGGPWTLDEKAIYNPTTGNLDIGAPGAPSLSIGDGATGNTVDASLLFRALLGIFTTASGSDRVQISNSVGGDGALLQTTNTLANPGASAVRFRAQSTGDKVMAIDVVGDTSRRLRIDSDGEMNWGPGNATPDSFLSRVSPGLLQASYIAYTTNGTTGVEQWNQPVFANGWGNSLSGTGLEYRRVAAPDNCVQWAGRILAPAGIVSGQAIIAAVPAAYRPQAIGRLLAANTTTGALVQLQMELAGTLTYRSGAVAGDNIDLTHCGNLVALNA